MEVFCGQRFCDLRYVLFTKDELPVAFMVYGWLLMEVIRRQLVL
jgi:hypothetical protein